MLGREFTKRLISLVNAGMIALSSQLIRAIPTSTPSKHADPARNPEARQVLGDGGQREGQDHHDQHREHQRDELAEDERRYDEAEREQDCSIDRYTV